jgi:hypothetical protein
VLSNHHSRRNLENNNTRTEGELGANSGDLTKTLKPWRASTLVSAPSWWTTFRPSTLL